MKPFSQATRAEINEVILQWSKQRDELQRHIDTATAMLAISNGGGNLELLPKDEHVSQPLMGFELKMKKIDSIIAILWRDRNNFLRGHEVGSVLLTAGYPGGERRLSADASQILKEHAVSTRNRPAYFKVKVMQGNPCYQLTDEGVERFNRVQGEFRNAAAHAE